MSDEIGGDLGARARRRAKGDVGGGALRAARRRFVIGGAFEDDRERPVAGRPVDIGGEPDPVARRHHDVALDDHAGVSRLADDAHALPPLPAASPSVLLQWGISAKSSPSLRAWQPGA